MKGIQPRKSRLRRAFVLAAAALGIAGGAATLDNLPKNPATDTHIAGMNLSPSDQMWKHTLSLRSDEARNMELMTAARDGDSWRVAALFENGVNARSAIAGDALAAAAFNGHRDVVEAMMGKGVDPTMNDSAAMLDALRGGHNDIALYLMALGAHANAADSQSLIIASYMGDHAMVQILLDRGADPAAQGSAAYYYAQEYGMTDIAATLKTAIDARTAAATGSAFDMYGPFLADDGASFPNPFSPFNDRPGPPGPF